MIDDNVAAVILVMLLLLWVVRDLKPEWMGNHNGNIDAALVFITAIIMLAFLLFGVEG